MVTWSLSRSSRPISWPKNHLLQEARQPCPGPAAPLTLHTGDSCPINHPGRTPPCPLPRPPLPPASIVRHFLSHLQPLPSQAGPEAHPEREREREGGREQSTADCPGSKGTESRHSLPTQEAWKGGEQVLPSALLPPKLWVPTSTPPGHPAGHIHIPF